MKKICSKCLCLTDRDICPECSSTELKEPIDTDYVFLAQVDSFTLPIFVGLLDKKGIDHKNKDELVQSEIMINDQFSQNESTAPSYISMNQMTQKIYVPFSRCDESLSVLKMITGQF